LKAEHTKKVKSNNMRRWLKNAQLNWLIKGIIFLLLAWVIYRQIIARENIDNLWAAFYENVGVSTLPWLIPALFLMPLNWAFETQKWRILIEGFSPLSFSSAYRAVFSGVTLSIFTPNRIGEYGGRILYVKPEHNWKAVIATLVGSYAQLLALLSMGMIGLIYFSVIHELIDPFFLPIILFLGFTLVAVLLFCFFNIDLIVPIARRLPFIHKLKRFVKHVKVLRSYSTKTLAKALLFALARYWVYALQYYLLIRFFGIEVSLLEGLAGISTIYLVQTSIPLPPLMGLFVRSEVALFVWGMYSANEIAILAATFGLWILNLIVPALIGTIFMLNINVLKSLGYEKNND